MNTIIEMWEKYKNSFARKMVQLAAFIVFLIMLFVIMGSNANRARSEYNKGYAEARANVRQYQNFSLGGNKDTVHVYHDGIKFSIFIKNDSMTVDISLNNKGK